MPLCHTVRRSKVAITIEEAVQEKVARLERTRLARECSRLDAAFEQKLADEGLTEDLAEWPEY